MNIEAISADNLYSEMDHFARSKRALTQTGHQSNHPDHCASDRNENNSRGGMEYLLNKLSLVLSLDS
jgi:hypothetical protein